jgi:hypothetical protein
MFEEDGDIVIGNALTETGSGYLLVANTAPEKFDLDHARVVNGRLCWPEDQNGGRPVVEFDHALLALERYETITERLTGLAPVLFDEPWMAVRKASSEQAVLEASAKLRDAISASPDVTEDDRFNLIGTYRAFCEKLIEVRWPRTSTERNRAPGPAVGLVATLNSAAAKLKGKSFGTSLETQLRAMSRALSNHAIAFADAETDQEALKKQDAAMILETASAIHTELLKRGKPGSADARGLATVLTAGA